MPTFVEQLARQLERELGPCPVRRDQLIEWINDQLNRCARLGVPGEAALAMINSDYVEWCALLLERDQPTEDHVRGPQGQARIWASLNAVGRFASGIGIRELSVEL